MFQSLPTAGLRWRAAALGLLLTGAAALPTQAQFAYTAGGASVTTQAYAALGASGTPITLANNDDANSAPQNIGFTFNYGTQPFTQFIFNTNGFIKLGSTPPSAADLYYTDAQTYTPISALESTDPADVNIIAPFNFDLEPGTGTVGFKMATTGTAPNRVCTIEWANVSDKAITIAKQYSKLSFQVKLYETTGRIDFVYGTFTAKPGTTAAYQGAPAGLIGTNPPAEAVTIGKASATAWTAVIFNDSLYTAGATA